MKKTRKRLQLQIETIGLFEVVDLLSRAAGGLKPSINITACHCPSAGGSCP